MADYKSGFVAIIGRPNVGKSTLLNTLIKQKIAIVSDRPQTTRNTITGVLTTDDYQIVFLDTPGLHTPKNKLSERMVESAYHALDSVDAALVLVDVQTGIGSGDRRLLERLNNGSVPYYIVLNKIETIDEARLREQEALLAPYDNAMALVKISALTGLGTELLQEKLADMLEPGPQYFPPDMITDQPERFVAAELIREKALLLLREEVPHGVGVEIEKIQERSESLMDIHAVIYCERKSHKSIIIGSAGSMLKQIGTLARLDLEKLFDTHVNLQLWVKIREDWRNNDHFIKELGYVQE